MHVTSFARCGYNEYAYALCIEMPHEEIVKYKILGTYDEEVQAVTMRESASVPTEYYHKQYNRQSIRIDVFINKELYTSYVRYCKYHQYEG